MQNNTTNRRLQAAEASLRLAAEDRAEAAEAVANGGRKQALRQLAWADERLAKATDRWVAAKAAGCACRQRLLGRRQRRRAGCTGCAEGRGDKLVARFRRTVDELIARLAAGGTSS